MESTEFGVLVVGGGAAGLGFATHRHVRNGRFIAREPAGQSVPRRAARAHHVHAVHRVGLLPEELLLPLPERAVGAFAYGLATVFAVTAIIIVIMAS